MKQWIVEKFIALSEVTGFTVPGWIRRLVPEETYALLSRREKNLTEWLEDSKDLREPELPDFLRERLDAVISREETDGNPAPAKIFPFPALGLAAAAAVFLGISIFLMPRGGVLIAPEQNVVATNGLVPAEPTTGTDQSPNPLLDRAALESDVLLEPLVEEQVRLASDMTNALQFFAKSILPDDYANQVNENLETFEDRITKSI